MATRSIVTSQPDVACDVCGRRLLRGELPDVFLAGGQRRTVCELCAPRAAHEGWLREADRHSVSLPPSRVRRGRNLFERLRSAARSDLRSPGGLRRRGPSRSCPRRRWRAFKPSPTTSWKPSRLAPEESIRRHRARRARIDLDAGIDRRRGEGRARAGGVQRRRASPARGGGRPLAGRAERRSSARSRIPEAWSRSSSPGSCSWYRYEVDLGDEAAGAKVTAQGTELGELAQEDLLVNATADEHGDAVALGTFGASAGCTRLLIRKAGSTIRADDLLRRTQAVGR